jgi:predicted XRE-type DNA-binding protein
MGELYMAKRKEEEIDVFVGSGNVFADLGYPNPEEALAKADLAHQIYKTIKARKLTQSQAAKILDIDQPKVSDIIRGKLSRYSIDRLMCFLRMLGKDIEIHIKEPKNKKSARVLSAIEDKPSKQRRAAI